ncbi:MAG: DUF4249 family protein [Candidatus Kryptoniota bacterium]
MALHIQSLRVRFFLTCFLLLSSIEFLSCNQPFQPKVEYTPKLVLYSVLFANDQNVVVRLTSTVSSANGNFSVPIHGADVRLGTPFGFDVPLHDSTFINGNDTVSYYSLYFPIFIAGGEQYEITAKKEGYDSAYAMVTVPNSFVTIPDQDAYSVMMQPKDASNDILLKVFLSPSTRAEFNQVLVEYRGFDNSGQFHVGSVSVLPVDSTNPFNEVLSSYVPLDINIYQYKSAFALAQLSADSLKRSHLYVDIIVTQVDDNLYRFFITSNRSGNLLSLRTDKIIFTNIFDQQGEGIVAAAAVDTTRVFLY